MNKISTLFKNLAMIYGTALMTAVFSEMVFFNEGPAYDILALLDKPIYIILWALQLGLWYSFAVAPIVWAISYFNVRSIWALFLIGCLFGLTTEGLIIPAIYYELPGSLLWVACSWHPFISFLLAWWGIRYVMQLGKPVYTIVLAAAIGTLWGTWSTYLIGFDVDPEAVHHPIGDTYQALKPLQFFIFSLVGTLVWVVGSLLVDRISGREFVDGKVERWGIVLMFLFFFSVIVLTVQVLALVFVLAVGVLCIGLRRNKQIEKRKNIFSSFSKIKLYQYILMLVMPVVATATHYIMTSNGMKLDAFLYAAPLSLAGAVMLILSFVRVFMQSKANA